MTRWIAAAVVFAVLSIGTAAGQEDDQGDRWMDRLLKTNADALHVNYAQGAECKISKEAVETIIDGILTRSRIKRLTYDEWLDADPGGFDYLYLDVVVLCDDRFFSVMVRFADMVKRHPSVPIHVMHHTRQYGNSGIHGDDNEYLKSAIKRGVENALTDYLKANFDL